MARGATQPVSWQVRFVALGAIWGSSFVLIKLAGREMTALQVSLGRIAFGAVVLLAILAVTRERLPRSRQLWAHLAVAGALMNAIPFTLFAWGELYASSILAGIWNATTPLMVLLVVLAWLPDERPTTARVMGLAVGFAGVLVVLAPWKGVGGPELAGHVAFAVAALCYGIGTPYMRRHIPPDAGGPVAVSAAQLVCATAMLCLVAPFWGGFLPDDVPSATALGSVAALGALGTGIAYVLYYALIRERGATVASMVTYVIPIFSTVAGVAILDEPLHWHEPLGTALVIVGIAVSSRVQRAPR